MPSGLMRKLSAMKTTTAETPRAPLSPMIRRVHIEMADERLYSVAPEALRRIGYTGGAFDIEKALFLDTETTGLSGGAGTVAFLVGVGYVEKGRLTVEQLLMPTYAHEGEMLERISHLMADKDTVIHFNGKTFDMPLLKSRFTMNRMQDKYYELNQLDLLHPAKRLWKLRLGSCRLCNLEKEILGFEREGDIPGSEVPERYFSYLKTNDFHLLEDIIDHNRQDIVTLMHLLVKLLDAYSRPDKATDPMDQLSLGKAFEKMGEWGEAQKMYRVAAMPRITTSIRSIRGQDLGGEANMRLYHICRKNGKYDEALNVLECMIRRRQMGAFPKIETAKIYEHRLGRYKDALRITREALLFCTEDEKEALLKREARLIRKTEKQESSEDARKWDF